MKVIRQRKAPMELALSRRELLGRSLAAAGLLGLGPVVASCGGEGGEAEGADAHPPETAGGENAAPGGFSGPLRVLVFVGDELPDPVRETAERELGFDIAFQAVPPLALGDLVFTQPGSFDVVSPAHFMFDWIWPSGNLQPLEISRILRWDEITPLFKLGKVDPGDRSCPYGEGDALFRKLYFDPERTGRWPTSPETLPELDGLIVQWVDEESGQGAGEEPAYCTGAPAYFGLDALGYNGDVIDQEPEQVSWAELLNPEWKGRVAIQFIPDFVALEVGLAARTLGLMEIENLGNPTMAEIDGLIEILAELKAMGHIRAIWYDFAESVELMSSGEVVIESMWYPAAAALQAQGFPVRYAAPPEGYRGWSSALAISARVTDPARLQACYDYINWWLSGPPGATRMRLGSYSPVLQTSQDFVEPGEYAYWIEGKPADKDYPGPFGEVSVRQGQIRDGGSFRERACRVGVWNSVFEEVLYLFERWEDALGVAPS